MTRKFSKLLVIDASIGRAAGQRGSAHPASRACREFLDSVYGICHRMVVTPEIKAEWDKIPADIKKQLLADLKAKMAA